MKHSEVGFICLFPFYSLEMKAGAFEAYNNDNKYSKGFHMQTILIAGDLE